MHPALDNTDSLWLLMRHVYDNSMYSSHRWDATPPTVFVLKNLSLVSKGFRNVALPLLFRHITIHHSGKEDAWQQSERQVDELLAFADLGKLGQKCRCFQFTVRLDWHYASRAEKILALQKKFPISSQNLW
ncbi:hypothetical protein BT69DRAFT_1285733, partial [Atractiella rhizophila]